MNYLTVQQPSKRNMFSMRKDGEQLAEWPPQRDSLRKKATVNSIFERSGFEAHS